MISIVELVLLTLGFVLIVLIIAAIQKHMYDKYIVFENGELVDTSPIGKWVASIKKKR